MTLEETEVVWSGLEFSPLTQPQAPGAWHSCDRCFPEGSQVVFNTTGPRIMLIGSSFWDNFRRGWLAGQNLILCYLLSESFDGDFPHLPHHTHTHTHTHTHHLSHMCLCKMDFGSTRHGAPDTPQHIPSPRYNFISNSAPVFREAKLEMALNHSERWICVCVCVCV